MQKFYKDSVSNINCTIFFQIKMPFSTNGFVMCYTCFLLFWKNNRYSYMTTKVCYHVSPIINNCYYIHNLIKLHKHAISTFLRTMSNSLYKLDIATSAGSSGLLEISSLFVDRSSIAAVIGTNCDRSETTRVHSSLFTN